MDKRIVNMRIKGGIEGKLQQKTLLVLL